MKCQIENGVLVVKTESETENKEMEEWRDCWHKEPMREKWLECRFYNPTQTVVI